MLPHRLCFRGSDFSRDASSVRCFMLLRRAASMPLFARLPASEWEPTGCLHTRAERSKLRQIIGPILNDTDPVVTIPKDSVAPLRKRSASVARQAFSRKMHIRRPVGLQYPDVCSLSLMTLDAKELIEHICMPEIGRLRIANEVFGKQVPGGTHARSFCFVIVVGSLACRLRSINGQICCPGTKAWCANDPEGTGMS